MTGRFDAKQIACWSDGELVRGRPDAVFGGVSIDSRSVGAGDLFVAISGPNHDAHEFLEAAATRGAAGFVVARGRTVPNSVRPEIPVIAAEDTTIALGQIAAGYRRRFTGPVVAITGSNGKTSTKEMCAAILSVSSPCLKNEGNLNNEFGLPLTLLRRGDEHRRVVVEVGMNHRGEIAPLAAIARPTVGVITNVGTAHIENLGSQEEIALEKGDLLAALSEDGVAVVNADDPRASAQAARTRARTLRFGRGSDADVRAESATSRGGNGYAFEIVSPDGRVAVEVEGVGETTIDNALAATAAALAAGSTLSDVAQGLPRFRPIEGRLVRRDLPGGVTLIDDTYNANPQSMAVALRSLVEIAERGRSIAVLGDMGELGADTSEAHRTTGRLAAELDVSRLVAIGEFATDVVAGAIEGGMDRARARTARDHTEAAAIVADEAGSDDVVLVKGSRAARMERVVELIAHRERD